MDSTNMLETPPSGVQVFIPAALNRPTHTLYSICMAVQPTQQEWTVNRRYSQFLQLRKDMLATLAKQNRCPGCASFGLTLRKFPFPMKTWIRTNRIVRRRVKSLMAFLQLVVARLYNDLPKCNICGDELKRMVRPFLIRGAQPIGDSTVGKIQHSLSLQSYAIINHRPKSRRPPQSQSLSQSPSSKATRTKTSPQQSTKSTSVDLNSSSSTQRTDSDPEFDDGPGSPSSVDLLSSTRSEDDTYAKLYDGEARCTDAKVPLEEALKQVVMLDKRGSKIEDVAFRLSSMWDGYDLQETLAEAPVMDLRLSATLEADYDDDDDEDDVLDSASERSSVGGWEVTL